MKHYIDADPEQEDRPIRVNERRSFVLPLSAICICVAAVWYVSSWASSLAAKDDSAISAVKAEREDRIRESQIKLERIEREEKRIEILENALIELRDMTKDVKRDVEWIKKNMDKSK